METLYFIFFSPRKAFQRLKEKPTFLIPFLLFVGISTFTTWVFFQKVNPQDFQLAMEKHMAKKKAPEIPAEKLKEIAEKQYNLTRKIAPVGALISSSLILLMLSAYFFGIFWIQGEEVNFKKSLSIIAHGYLPMVLAGLLSLGVIFLKGEVSFIQMKQLLASNPGFFVSMEDQPVLHALLSSLDLFVFWVLFLWITGFTLLFHIPKKKAFFTIGGTWLAYVAVKVALRALFS